MTPDTRLRVAAVIASLQCGGAERVMTTLCNAWTARHDVTLYTFAPPDEMPFFPLVDSVRHRPLDLLGTSASIVSGAVANMRRIRILGTTLRDLAPDVVVAFGDQTNVVTALGSLGAAWPLVVSERVDPRTSPLRWPWETVRRVAYRRADAIVLVAEETRAWVPPSLASRVRVIANPVAAAPAGGATGALGCSDGPLSIVAVGRLARQKGHDILLRALQRLPEDLATSWTLTIVGDGPERAPLQRLADALGLADRIRWPGQVPDPSLWVRGADVFVLPSRFEGFPNALVEAMALGRAVVAADCRSGPREIIDAESTGLLVPPESPTALADALARLLRDADLRVRLGHAAAGATGAWSVDRIAGEWEHLFAALVQERRRNKT